MSLQGLPEGGGHGEKESGILSGRHLDAAVVPRSLSLLFHLAEVAAVWGPGDQ